MTKLYAAYKRKNTFNKHKDSDKFKENKAHGREIIYPANSKNIKAGVTILISDIHYKTNTP